MLSELPQPASWDFWILIHIVHDPRCNTFRYLKLFKYSPTSSCCINPPRDSVFTYPSKPIPVGCARLDAESPVPSFPAHVDGCSMASTSMWSMGCEKKNRWRHGQRRLSALCKPHPQGRVYARKQCRDRPWVMPCGSHSGSSEGIPLLGRLS